MSLKAKIEAVIYASEEPVTLQQLVGLLGVEAQAEIDALDTQQGSLLPLEDAVEEEASSDGLDPEALHAETLEGSAGAEETQQSANETQSPEAPNPEAGPPASATPEQTKRQTRERERRLREYFRTLLDRLIAEYAEGDRGLEVREVAGGFRFATKPEFHDTVRGFVRSLKPPLKLSLQALETLAVVAYKQPVTVPEISEIRGVDSGGVLGSLIARKLITTAGRKQVIGRPILYKTTKEFLLRFGLRDTSELPSIEEFERMAGELNEAVQEEIEMDQASAAPNRFEESSTVPSRMDIEAVEPMRDMHESQADGFPDSAESQVPDDNASDIPRE